jgi:FKBP-type peptidyl-prolyl cis-trans isomerase
MGLASGAGLSYGLSREQAAASPRDLRTSERIVNDQPIEAQGSPPPKKKPGKFRLTLGWMVLIVALAALAINAFRPSRTRIIDVKPGTGPAVKAGDSVSVHYVGKLADGKVFDESKPRGLPFEVVVGQGRVIKGWDVGIVGMQAGGVRKLVIPPEEAYGTKGVGSVIPPNSTLYFEIELLGIK